MSAEDLQAILDGPALPIPDGVVPGHLNQGKHTVGFTSIYIQAVLCTLSVVARLILHLSIRRADIGDFSLVLALGFAGALLYVEWKIVDFPGLFLHQWNLQMKYLPPELFRIHIGVIIYNCLMLCLRVSILIEWLWLFAPRGTRNWLFWTFHVMIWSNTVFYTLSIFLEIYQCNPREKIWNPLYVGGHCSVDGPTSRYATAVVEIICNFAILILPQWVIWHLHTSWHTRLGISLLFLIGIIACIYSILRFVYLAYLFQTGDATYYYSYLAIFGNVQITVGFLVLGTPALPAMLKMVRSAKSTMSRHQSSKRSGDASVPRANRAQDTSVRSAQRRLRGPTEDTDMDTLIAIPIKTASDDRALSLDAIDRESNTAVSLEGNDAVLRMVV